MPRPAPHPERPQQRHTITQFDLDDTDITLGYDRAVADSTLTVDGDYTADQIDNLLTLGDFGPGVDGAEDLSQLNGTGNRQFYGLSAGLALAAAGAGRLRADGAGFNGLDYANTTDPGLPQQPRHCRCGACLLQLSPVTGAQIGLN